MKLVERGDYHRSKAGNKVDFKNASLFFTTHSMLRCTFIVNFLPWYTLYLAGFPGTLNFRVIRIYRLTIIGKKGVCIVSIGLEVGD